MYKSGKVLQIDLHVFMLILKFWLFAFFTKKQVTLLPNASKKVAYPGSSHTLTPLCTVQSCWSRMGRGQWNRVALLAVGASACLLGSLLIICD